MNKPEKKLKPCQIYIKTYEEYLAALDVFIYHGVIKSRASYMSEKQVMNRLRNGLVLLYLIRDGKYSLSFNENEHVHYGPCYNIKEFIEMYQYNSGLPEDNSLMDLI